MIDLDKASVVRELDVSGMLTHLNSFPTQCRQAWKDVQRFELPRDYRDISTVIILGMGASAIGGDIVRRLATVESTRPVVVHRDYCLPAFIDERTLIIASSYSGNTEETLSAFNESLKTRARKLVVTSGGKLKQLAEDRDIPLFLVDYKAPPRAAFAHSFIPMVGIFQKLGLLTDKSADLREAAVILDEIAAGCMETMPRESNPAKQLAARLHGNITVIYGAEMLTEVAQRWKAQMNENGKTWAFCESFPELNHNAVVGYQFPLEAKERVFVVMLRSPSFSPRNLLRYSATADLLSRAGVAYELVVAPGVGTMTQVLSSVLLGDYVSFYLAVLNEVDPTSVDAIDFVKNYLARSVMPGQ